MFSAEARQHMSDARKLEWAKGLRSTEHLNTLEVNNKKKMNNAKYWLGKKRPDISEKLSKANMGRSPTNKGVSRPEIRGNNNPMNRIGIREKQRINVKRGSEHPCWKGGITPLIRIIRKSPEMIIWRKLVFKRDNYSCQFCGLHSGNGKRVILHADHIKAFALYPELRFELSNGRTLCKDCHRKTDTYGYKTVKLSKELK